MEECKINHDALYRLMEIKCERETLEYVLDGMKKVLGEDLPDADQVQAYWRTLSPLWWHSATRWFHFA